MFELIGGILILIAVLTFISFALVGLGIYGAAKGLSAVFRRLTGKTRRPRAMGPSKDSSRQSQHTAPSPVEAPPRPQVHPYVHLDVDGGATAQGIEDVMRAYTHERVVGPYAQAAMQSLAMARRREASLMSEIDSRFSPRSISWDHFASTVKEALDAILRNCALLANRVQTFDVEDYEHSEWFYSTGGEMANGKRNPAVLKRWELLRETKAEMDRLCEANDGLLLELDKLSAELGKMRSDQSTEESSRVADEVKRRVEETKYYR